MQCVLIEYQITHCYRKITFILKYDDNANINKAMFLQNYFSKKDSLKLIGGNLFIFLENNF